MFLLNNIFKIYIFLVLTLISNNAYTKEIQQVLRTLGKNLQMIFFYAVPVSVMVIAFMYSRGKSEAKERAENLIIGAVLAVAAFSLTSLVGK